MRGERATQNGVMLVPTTSFLDSGRHGFVSRRFVLAQVGSGKTETIGSLVSIIGLGKLDFISGGIEPGEIERTALIREIREELPPQNAQAVIGWIAEQGVSPLSKIRVLQQRPTHDGTMRDVEVRGKVLTVAGDEQSASKIKTPRDLRDFLGTVGHVAWVDVDLLLGLLAARLNSLGQRSVGSTDWRRLREISHDATRPQVLVVAAQFALAQTNNPLIAQMLGQAGIPGRLH